MNQSKLDDIISRHKAQPVGHGYIDIIVSRDNYVDLVVEIVNNGYMIKSISWWEWCPNNEINEYGLGGPESNYYNGWFSELPVEVDDIEFDKSTSNENKIAQIIRGIESKEISFPNEIVTFKKNEWLTPAVWLDVPEEWRNTFCA